MISTDFVDDGGPNRRLRRMVRARVSRIPQHERAERTR
jgi:hypothetical protein